MAADLSRVSAGSGEPDPSARVFVGLTEIGDYTTTLSRGLRACGLEVRNVTFENDSPLLVRDHRPDRQLRARSRLERLLVSTAEFYRQREEADCFIFSYCQNFLAPWLKLPVPGRELLASRDLRWLRRHGKTTVMVSQGDDLRDVRVLVEDLKEHGLEEHARHVERVLVPLIRDDRQRDLRARLIEREADHVLARPLSAQRLRREYWLNWIPVDLEGLEFEVTEDDVPRVVHAPSHHEVKGTRFVLEAVESLKREGLEFEFELCQGRDNREVRELLRRSHVVVDQLILPGYGLLAVEALASGNLVLGSAVGGYNGFEKDLPVVTATPATIRERLREAIEDGVRRRELARQGRAYVERVHDHRVVARDLARRLGLLAEPTAGEEAPC